jgi:hypothetical protein
MNDYGFSYHYGIATYNPHRKWYWCKNYSGKPVAGAISATTLEYFTQEHCTARLDIAGVALAHDESQ